MENDLSTPLPCPFCGVAPRVMLADAQLGHHKIVCGGCRDLNVETLLFLEPSSAIDAWNKRAESKSLAPVEATGSETATRNTILMEALEAVENERLANHETLLAKYDASSVFIENSGDEAYSAAIRDAEKAIKRLLSSPSETKGTK